MYTYVVLGVLTSLLIFGAFALVARSGRYSNEYDEGKLSPEKQEGWKKRHPLVNQIHDEFWLFVFFGFILSLTVFAIRLNWN